MRPNRENIDMDFPDVTQLVQEAEQVIRQCFTEHRLDEVFLSFNGGKDCTVLLDLTIRLLRDMYKRQDIATQLKVVYIRTTEPFIEIENFVTLITDHFKVNLIVTEGEMKEALQRLLETDTRLKAVLMGTRRTDPYSKHLEFIQKTDENWPQILRVSPLLNWTYHDIWSYILNRHVPYCCLYDRGYTSIGSVSNTLPNPSLVYKERRGEISYLPAWRLIDETLERAGRSSLPPKHAPLAPSPAPPPSLTNGSEHP